MTSKVTIGKRLVNMQLLTAAIVLLLSSTAFIVNDVIKFRQNLESELSSTARVIGFSTVSALAFSDEKEGAKALSSLKSQSNIIGGVVFDMKGKVFASYGAKKDLGDISLPVFNGEESINFSHDHVVLFSKIYQDGEVIGTICLKSTLDALSQSYRKFALIVLATLLVGLFAAFFIAHSIQGKLSNPITSLVEVVSRITESSNYDAIDGEKVLSKESSDVFELATLIDKFMTMIAKIRSHDRALRESNELLEQKVWERTAELVEIQKKAVLVAHQAGMAEVATGVLHNVGNILNSVNGGAENIERIVRGSGLENFTKANNLLQENKSNLANFFLNDPRGKKLPEFYIRLEEALSFDFKKLQSESSDLLKKIQLIKDVVSLQQNYAKGAEFKEDVYPQEAVESALLMQHESLLRHDIKIVKKFSDTKPILAQKAKLVHVLLNLIKNAKEAMIANKGGDKVLTIEIGKGDGKETFIKISDNGIGVSSENLNKIFTHGFTTKKEGHGFGLHYCANAVTEMGGKLSAHSEGENRGVVFSISFKPVA